MSYKKTGNGFEQVKKLLNDFSCRQSKTGWPTSAQYKDGTPVADVAQYQEYGTPRGIPPRPFVRTAIAKDKAKWMQSMGSGVKAAIAGKVDAKTVLANTALMAAGDIAKSIQAVDRPPLNPSTIKRKGFSKPLVDTGLMIQSVTGIAEEKT